MDEFDKIRELSEGLSNRKEPVFTGFNQSKEPSFHEVSAMKASWNESSQQPVAHSQEHVLQEEDENFEKSESQSVSNSFSFMGTEEGEVSFDPLTQDVGEKDLPNMRFHLVFILLLFVLLVLSLIGFFVFRMENSDSDEITTITASQDVVKEAPEQAGGMNIPDQDKLVYNRIRTDSVTTKVESLFPEPEKPVLPQILAIEQNAPEEDFVSMNEVEAIDPLKEASTLDTEVNQEASGSKINDTAVAIHIEKPKLPVVKQEEIFDEKPKKEVITLAPVTLPESAIKIEKVSVQEGVWRVQLFASNSKEAVEKAWKRIELKHNKLLSNMSYLIKKVEIKGKGDFYRLQVGQFPTREMADGLCVKLKAKKQDCIPTK